MNDRRVKGLEKQISNIIGNAILSEVNNDKIRNLVSVYKVSLSKDGRYVDIVFSLLNYKENINKEKILEQLNKLKGYFRKKLSMELNIRYTPEIRVSLDETIEHAIKMSNLIDKLIKL